MSWDFAYDSPGAITELLATEGLSMTKKFGQNFLLSEAVRQRIVTVLDVAEDQRVWEIGPGIGALTTLLLAQKVHLTAFEIDYGFCKILSSQAFADENNFKLISGDALKTLPKALEEFGCPDRICGNLPYNVGSVVIAKLLESSYRPEVMVFTLQKEVVDRICAVEGSKDWSSFSLLGQMDYDPSLAFNINSGAFYPPPNVQSSVVVFRLRKQSRVADAIRPAFMLMLRELFSQRRKTIKNNLLAGRVGSLIGKEGVSAILAQSSLDPTLRAEALCWEQFLALSSSLSNYLAK
ncbi:MAG: ribosomal RNA small subunit methyltransferase A [Spirochaetia bacterium]|nr:ribosomal RNA small subunit methyltransferase A [Spirochaetia bacterium]